MTPLPEPKYHARDDFDYYTEAQLRQYGTAEYKRGIEEAAVVCAGLWYVDGQFTANEFAEEVRKLGETS